MISAQQNKIRAFPYSRYTYLICDGAVRSGKTSIIMWTFIDWAMHNFNGQRFGIGGHTVGSAIQNIIMPFMSMRLARERYKLKWRGSSKELTVRRGNVVNVFEVCGGKDESSYMLIQGRTWAGVLLDEIVLMPESFVSQALARCSVTGARFFFSCNSGNPEHWFKKQWIDRAAEKNALYLHFSMRDNPALSAETLERYEHDFHGVFYQRYVLGCWAAAEGLIYSGFDATRHVLDELPETTGDYYISSDYGIQNATVFLLWQKQPDTGRWVCLDEWYYSGREREQTKTVSALVDGMEEMLAGRRPKTCIIDPSAAALIAELHKRGYKTWNAVNDVVPGIEDVATMLQRGGIAFSSLCKNTMREFGLYAWDEKAANRGEDAPIKQNDHCMDAVRYFVKTMHIVQKFGKAQYIPLHNRR
jgi:PBSX family phage terminase large subunit